MFQGLPTEPEVEPIWGHSELEGHSLVRFRHPGGGLAPGREQKGVRLGSGLPRPRPAPAPTELVAAEPPAQARPTPASQPCQRPAGGKPSRPRSGQAPLHRPGVRKGVKALKTSGSRRAVKGGLGVEARCPGQRCLPQRGGVRGPQPRPQGARRVLATALRPGPPGGPCAAPAPLTARAHRCLRAGPVALARVPASFRPATPPRPPRNLTPAPKFGPRTQMRGGNQSPPRHGGNGEGRAAFRKVTIAPRSGDPAEGGGGVWVSRERVALELKIVECRGKVSRVSLRPVP